MLLGHVKRQDSGAGRSQRQKPFAPFAPPQIRASRPGFKTFTAKNPSPSGKRFFTRSNSSISAPRPPVVSLEAPSHLHQEVLELHGPRCSRQMLYVSQRCGQTARGSQGEWGFPIRAARSTTNSPPGSNFDALYAHP